MKPTTFLVLDTRRQKSDGTYPVYIRVVYLRDPRNYKTGISLSESDYEKATGKSPGKTLVREAKIMQAALVKASGIIDKMDTFTWDKFATAYYGKAKDASNIFPFFEVHMDALKELGHVKTMGTYLCASNSLKSFQNKIAFGDITPTFLNKYQTWMIKQGRSITTVGIYLRSLRTIYNAAIAEEVIPKDSSYPFQKGKYSIPAGRNIKKALAIDEVAKIISYQPRSSAEQKARDFWLLSYYCSGINFKDLSELRNENIDGDMLRFVRAKTSHTGQGNQITISLHLIPQAVEIVNRWRSCAKQPFANLFSIVNQEDTAEAKVKKVAQFIKSTNYHMKAICEDLKIEKSATTYFSRHSAATILKKSGASIEQIQELLGHASSATTKAYLASFDDDTKKSLASLLLPQNKVDESVE